MVYKVTIIVAETKEYMQFFDIGGGSLLKIKSIALVFLG